MVTLSFIRVFTQFSLINSNTYIVTSSSVICNCDVASSFMLQQHTLGSSRRSRYFSNEPSTNWNKTKKKGEEHESWESTKRLKGPQRSPATGNSPAQNDICSSAWSQRSPDGSSDGSSERSTSTHTHTHTSLFPQSFSTSVLLFPISLSLMDTLSNFVLFWLLTFDTF